MINSIVSYLLQNLPWLACIFVVAVAGWKLSKYHSSVEDAKEKIKQLPCESHQVEIDIVRKTMSKLDAMGDQLAEITKWVMKLDKDEIDILAPKFSPRMMTKAGEELYKISGSQKALEDNFDYFIKLVEEQNPQTPLDVEDLAYSVLIRNMSNPIFNGIKNYIYYQPEEISLDNEDGSEAKVSLSLLLLLRLMSLKLRDKYLSLHPDIK